MALQSYQSIENEIEVTACPDYVSERSRPRDGLYFFSYKITVKNHSKEGLKLVSRHWVIRDGNKSNKHIQGQGVVGQRPWIGPGESFSYTSFCPLPTSTGSMRGKYQFETKSGRPLWASIPLFFLRVDRPMAMAHQGPELH